jgi:hypothetical protein
MLVMLGEQPACYGQRSCIHDHGELAETTVGSLDTADGKYSSVTFGSIQAMLTSPLSMGHGDWSVGSSAGFLVAPGPGADRSPAAGFMSGQSPGREAELPNARTIANDAVRKPQFVRTITANEDLIAGQIREVLPILSVCASREGP